MLKFIAISTFFYVITISDAMVSRCYFSAGNPSDNPFQECRPNSNTPSCFTFTCSGFSGSNGQVFKGCNDIDDHSNVFQCSNLKSECQRNNGVPDCQTCTTDMCNGNGASSIPRLSLMSAVITVPAIAALIAKLS